jgi:23S rRNA A2030 N6-methylase RlmJ
LQLAAERDRQKALAILDRMETILRQEIVRTELSLLAAARDSRLGFQFEQDYVYTPYSLREKLGSLHETLEKQLAERRKKTAAGQN